MLHRIVTQICYTTPPPPQKGERPKRILSSFGLSFYVVEVAGFEPTTTCTPSKCATRLRYTSNVRPVTDPGIIVNADVRGVFNLVR